MLFDFLKYCTIKNSSFPPTFQIGRTASQCFSPWWKSRADQLYLCALQMPEYSLWPGDIQSHSVEFSGSSHSAPSHLLKCQLFAGASPGLVCFPCQLVRNQLENPSFVWMCHTEYWISSVCKCFLFKSSRSRRIWFYTLGTDSSQLLSLQNEHTGLRIWHTVNQKTTEHPWSSSGAMV